MALLNLNFELKWHLSVDNEEAEVDPLLFKLMAAIRQGGHLNYAAKQTGVSYRHAWGLIKNWEARLGTELVIARQGSGAYLSDAGEGLLGLSNAAEQSLAPELDRVALETAAKISELLGSRRQTLKIATSHNERIIALRDVLQERYAVQLDVTGSQSALNAYVHGDADIACFHLPEGELGKTVAAKLIDMLDQKRDQIWLLDQRQLGLMSRQERPVADLSELANGDLRLINRQPGSGTRLSFDALLAKQQISPTHIQGYSDEEFTHTAVAALVSSGSADAAFGSVAIAQKMNLHTVALLSERVYLVVRRQFDSALRQSLATFCANQAFEGLAHMRPDELAPSVAALKRIHKAGFWKSSNARSK